MKQKIIEYTVVVTMTVIAFIAQWGESQEQNGTH